MGMYTKAELSKKTKADLLELIEEHDLEVDEDATKSDLVEALLEVPEPDEDEVEDDELDDEAEDDEVEDDEVDDEEEDVVEEEPAPKKSKKPAKKKTESNENTLQAKQVATILGTEAKTLRQFFRSEASTVEAVGSGGRYEFLETDVPKIKEEFEAWKAAHASRGRGRPAGSGGGRKAKKVAEAEIIEEVEEIEELEIEELDDEIDEDDLELEDED